MIIKKVVVGDLETNCYIIEDDGNLVIIDPGAEAEKIFAELSDNKIRSCVVILTHVHPDHIGAVDEISGKLKCPIYMHTLDSAWLKQIFGSVFPGLHNVEDKEIIKASSLHLKVIHTPGHSEGGICLYIEKEGILFSGDTLFQGDVGRTDLMGGSKEQLVASIKKLMKLPDTVKVYPGHSSNTTIEKEKQYNWFVKELGI